ncbi:MAG: tetratricopeptide repeat protein, partial [Coriobacteriales bacterium]|nr:tetratricopeptide repeat protein [Coriobacteriales bacterium]
MTDRAMRRVVIDTNVLLADPQALMSFPNAEVVVPETVLGELDKLKTSRVDPDLRFRGREVSRVMFELSDQGSLVDGVDLPDGGRLRVAPFDPSAPIPEGLATRNADDRILATAWQVLNESGADAKATLITNDLNMLLKAQTLGIPVERHGEGVEGSWSRRMIVRPFQRYRIPIAILAVAIAVFAGVLVVLFASQQRTTSTAELPAEFKALLTVQQQRALDSLTTLERNPRNPEALLRMATFYNGQRESATTQGDPAAAIEFAQQGIRYYERYLDTSPNDSTARADYAALLFTSGQTDRAIQQVGQVLKQSPNNVTGNYNLGIFYWQGRRDYDRAAAQIQKVIRLTQDDPRQHSLYQEALALLQQIKK